MNETKLSNAVRARSLRPATEEEIRAVGAVPGYASPYGLAGVRVIVDELAARSPNLVAGANDEGYHLLHTNYGRDYTAELVTDITAAGAGDACPNCGSPLRLNRGVELGNIFKLGTRYSDALGCTFADENGVDQPVIMGSYGIGLGRLLACVVEEHHDDKGICWPASLAPFPLHMVVLSGKSGLPDAIAAELQAGLAAAGVDALVDDRAESPGVKFNDADLIGLPLRLTVSERSVKHGTVEFKHRAGGEPFTVPVENAVAEVLAQWPGEKTYFRPEKLDSR